MVYAYNEILLIFTLKKKGTSFLYGYIHRTWMNLLSFHVKTCEMKEARHKRTNIEQLHLYEVLGIVKFLETERRMGGHGNGKYCVIGRNIV